MFPPTRTSTIAQRALDAARLARSFLLLEDDYDVDWEVDQDQRDEPEHPHRAQLRNRARVRRAGAPVVPPQPCLSPVPSTTRSLRSLRAAGLRAAACRTRLPL
jgi:hypothetical protein